ncbi:unnamed protein product, partial [Ilex paraguariensis]
QKTKNYKATPSFIYFLCGCSIFTSNTQNLSAHFLVLRAPKMKVDIISSELIKPSSPTPSEFRDFKLSFLDERIPPTYVPLIFYYSQNESTSNIKQSHMSNILKESLSQALTQFYPLAGRMKGQISVDCSDEGVCYVEAQVDSELTDIIECSEAKVFDQLIPYKIESVKEELAIQVTFFSCGGIVVGMCISHRIADGCTLCTFIKAWAATARGERNTVCPIFNLSSLFPPRDSPDFMPVTNHPAIRPPTQRVVTKRFVFTASGIAALKSELVKTNSNMLLPTRVEAVSALIWKCCIAATRRKNCSVSVAFHPVNFRKRMDPPLPENSFGNIFQMASAVTSGETDLGSLVGKLRGAIGKIDGDYIRKLQGEDGFDIVRNNFKEIGKLLSQGDVQVLRFSSWCGFPIYEADFGWGNPTWVSSASFSNIDSIKLMDSRGVGGIEAWVILAEEDMMEFEKDVELQLYTTLSS